MTSAESPRTDDDDEEEEEYLLADEDLDFLGHLEKQDEARRGEFSGSMQAGMPWDAGKLTSI